LQLKLTSDTADGMGDMQKVPPDGKIPAGFLRERTRVELGQGGTERGAIPWLSAF
jgi:hypothetical protein